MRCKRLRILLTGCAGFIGSHLAFFLMKQGATVIGVDNLSRKGAQTNLAWLQLSYPKAFMFCQADVRDTQNINKIFQTHNPFDIVIHEAGQVAVTYSVENPREDFEINAFGTFNILEATRLFSPDAFFAFASTNKVYGAIDSISVQQTNNRYDYLDAHDGISESFPLDFYSPYGCSKGAADQYVRDYARLYSLKTVVLRQSCIYGPRQFGVEDQGWVAWLTIAAILNKPITIYGDGMQVRDVLWIEDLVEAYIRLYENRKICAGKIYNVGGGPDFTMSLLELLSYLEEAGELNQTPRFSDWRPGDQKVYISDIAKIKTDTGWDPLVSPKEGVFNLIQWVKENKPLLEKTLGK